MESGTLDHYHRLVASGDLVHDVHQERRHGISSNSRGILPGRGGEACSTAFSDGAIP